MENKYIDAFLDCVVWQFKRSDIMTVSKEEKTLSNIFIETFPKMSFLLRKAIVLNITLKDNSHFQFFCWENNNSIGGWLCRCSEGIDTNIVHLDILKKEIGTIVESWGFEDVREDVICNMNMVLGDDYQCGIGDLNDYYIESCDYENLQPKIKDEDYIVIAEESNGNLTLCNKDNEKIILFASDHCFDYVTVYDGCPEYTFYTINDVHSLVDYFELVAQQWLSYLK